MPTPLGKPHTDDDDDDECNWILKTRLMIKTMANVRRPYIVKMENIYVLAFLYLFHFSPGGTYETPCSSGERLHTPRVGHNVCIPCLRGTFMDTDQHVHRECKPCTGIENSDVEVLVSACNSTRDDVILCRDGFYRRKAWNVMEGDRCEKCTDCPFPARPCGGYYNTVCCPPNHDAVMTPDGVFVCNERPVVCGAGQFFWTPSKECLPCPAGTFMSVHSYTHNDCLKCEELSENNLTQAVIIRPCSRIAPTLFGCKAGYFRDPTQESLQIEAPCTPCRICNRSLTDCGMFHDAVCDDEDRMVSAAATNLKVPMGTSEGVRTIKQLKATFNGSLNCCILDCMEGGFTTLEDRTLQSESSKRKCLLSSFSEIYKAVIVDIRLISSCIIGMLVLLYWTIWQIQTNLAVENCRKWYSYLRRFANGLFVLNLIGVILLIVAVSLVIIVIEDKDDVAVYITIYCIVVLILNTVLTFWKNLTDIKKCIAPVNGENLP